MNDDFDLPFPHYRCPTCGKELPVGEARVTVTCADHRGTERREFSVRQATDSDRHDIELICDRALGETEIDAFDRTFDVLENVNLLAETDGRFAGMLSLAFDRGEVVLVFMSVYPEFQGTGAGTALLEAAGELAAARGLQFLRASATNDDVSLLYFYQRHGFAIYDVAIGYMADRFGSATPGFSGIPVRDEIRLRRAACS